MREEFVARLLCLWRPTAPSAFPSLQVREGGGGQRGPLNIRRPLLQLCAAARRLFRPIGHTIRIVARGCGEGRWRVALLFPLTWAAKEGGKGWGATHFSLAVFV